MDTNDLSLHGLIGGGGLKNFFGDGSDGAFNPATILANGTTAPNGGVVANLWDMNTGTVFTTGSLTSASDCVLFQIDFGAPTIIGANSTIYHYMYGWRISTGANRNVALEWSDDGITWASNLSFAVSTTAGDRVFQPSEASLSKRYMRFVLKAGGSTCTFSVNGLTINAVGTDTQTTKVWNIIYPSTLNGPAVIKQFSSLTLPAGYTMTVENPCQGLIIYCQGNAQIDGTIDMSKKAGLAPNGNIIPMPITKKAKKTAKTSALLHFNGNVTDDSGRTWTNNGSATFDTTNKKFGSHAISFNGSNQWIDTPASDDFSFGQDDFTIDCWIRPTVASTSMRVCGMASSYDAAWLIERASTNKMECGVYHSDGTSTKVYSLAALSINTWYHVAFIRNGGFLRLYIDGVLQEERIVGAPVKPVVGKMSIGRMGEYASAYWTGQIDELRIIKGRAVWTANFTPPTAEYTYTATYTDEPKTFEKYLQLTTVLQPLRGGNGGNGGYGGSGYTTVPAGRITTVGIGGSGRINQGGFGGGGTAGNYGSSGNRYGGIGGSIKSTENVSTDTPAVGMYSTNFFIDMVNGAGGIPQAGAGVSANQQRCFGGGGGGGACSAQSGATYVNYGGNGEYAGGFILLVCGGTVSGTGALKADGGKGGSGGAPARGTGIACPAGGGGGGGGAGGGVIEILYAIAYSFSGTITVNGGPGGAAGLVPTGDPNFNGENGGAGTSGGIGTIHIQQI